MLSEAKLFAVYMMIGASWSCSSFALYSMWHFFQFLATATYFIVQAGMLTCFWLYPQSALICFLAFLIGYLLQALYLNSLISLQRFRLQNPVKGSGTVIQLTGALTGAITCGTCALFESLYYTNRDVLYWVTINNSVIPFVFLSLGLMIASCLRCKLNK